MKAEVFVSTAKKNVVALELLHQKHITERDKLNLKHKDEVRALGLNSSSKKFVERWVKQHLDRDIFDDAFSDSIDSRNEGIFVRLNTYSFCDYESVTIPYAAFSNIKVRKLFVEAFVAGFFK